MDLPNQVLIKQGRHLCETCGSSDGLAYYEEASHCFSCGEHKFYDTDHRKPTSDTTKTKTVEDIVLFDTSELKTLPLTDRGISLDVAEKYGVMQRLNPTTGQPMSHFYPMYDRGMNGKQLGWFIRDLPKQFRVDPAGSGYDHKCGLFGQNIFPAGCAKAITITEGCCDAMAGFQMFGSKYPFVSVPMGADTGERDVKRNLEYLESFERVYICFDRDDPGQRAAIACAKLLSPGKAHIVALDPKLKDANNYLKEGKAEQFVKTWWNAVQYKPSNILASSQLKDRIRNRDLTPGIPYPYEGLNTLTYGIRKGELVVITAPTGVGKTSLLREIEYNILKEDPKAKVGAMFLEESPEDSGLGLMSVDASVPFHLPDAQYTTEQYDEAEKILDEDRVYFFDHFGSTAIDDIVSRVRYYAKGLGCDYIFLDHLSILVSDQQQGDERKKLDEITTKLKTLIMELNIALIAVVHTNRQGQIRGTAGIEQMANIVVELDRDIKAADESVRTTLQAVVAKNRFSGRTGPAFAARYNTHTGRLVEVDNASWTPTDQDLQDVFNDDTFEEDMVK